MDVINKILQDSVKESAQYKSIQVNKHLELQFDLGHLIASDPNEIDKKILSSSKNTYLLNLARDNTQLLFNEIWKLPTNVVDDVVVVNLPRSTTILPRSQPAPKAKQMTKWEKFALEKGIVKKKKDKKKWDDVLKKWIPRHGYKRAEAEEKKTWLLEVPETADPYEDQFEKRINVKSEKVAKNEFQRLRNIAKASNIKIPKVGFTPTSKPSASQLGKAITVAKVSTASLGKFQKGLPKEQVAKNVQEFLPGNKKRKPPVPSSAEEKKMNLSLIDSVLNKKPKLNLDQAVDRQVHIDNREEAFQKSQKKKSKGKRSKAGAKGGKYRLPKNKKAAAPQTGGKGAGKSSRLGGKTKGGRKRR